MIDYCPKHDLFDCWYCPDIGRPRPTVTTVDHYDVSTVKIGNGWEVCVFDNNDPSFQEEHGRFGSLTDALERHDEVVAELYQDAFDTLTES